jgi:hypothetical protein
VAWWKVLVGALAFLVIMRAGFFVLRTLGRPVPEPDPGELRRVNLRYRCSICGAEVKMTKAGEELPEPPRHCLEDMDLQAPIE